MSGFIPGLKWLLLGVLIGWLLSWLFQKWFRRNERMYVHDPRQPIDGIEGGLEWSPPASSMDSAAGAATSTPSVSMQDSTKKPQD